ncbi:MAG TPA: hypothetical protein VLL08_12130 [Kineosporiaceae bacterium]|nr:hypothetical protein [Kineosporiaceae bacterium]
MHEFTVAALGAILLAVAMTWPILRHPFRTIPQDIYDPTFFAWLIAWDGHALLRNPATHNLFDIWNTNVMFPEQRTLAFSDSLLGYAPFGALGSGPEAALFEYNLLWVLSFAMAAFGAYALVRQLGATRAAAVVVAVAFAYSPWRFTHGGHLNILSTGGILLAFAMLARGHGWSLKSGYSPEKVRPYWALAGWLTAAWQVTLGFALGISFVYVLAAIGLVAVLGWLFAGRPRLPARLVAADLGGGLLFLGITAAMAYPYLKVLAEHPDAQRSVAWVELFSPPFRGFLTAGDNSWLWGAVQQEYRGTLLTAGEMALLPGFALLALAALGLLVSSWSLKVRLALAAGVVGTVWMALGTKSPGHGKYGYLLLYDHLPGFDGSRTPGRLVLWAIVLLCIMAAGTLTGLQHHLTRERPATQRVRRRALPALAVLVVSLSLVAVVAEGVNKTPHPDVPVAPVALSTLTAPVLVLPTDELADFRVMLWSTDGFPQVANGSSSYNPPTRETLRKAMLTFPDAQSVGMLRNLGVKTVLVLPEAAGSPYAPALAKSGAPFGLQRSDRNGTVAFTISP